MAEPLAEDCFALPPGTRWTPVAEALAALRERVHSVVGEEEVPLSRAAGRIPAAPVCASWDVPRSANAAVDGYAFAARSLTAEGGMGIAPGRAAAGHPWPGELAPGQALRIFTGAPMPSGADTVAMQEEVEVARGRLRVPRLLEPGTNVRSAGEDLGAGEATVVAGAPLRPQDLAQAASGGAGALRVRRRLRVGVLSTGDELRQPGMPLAAGGVADANRPMLQGMLRSPPFEMLDLGIAPDSESRLRRTLDRARERCDAVVASGGASGGDEDHLARLLAAEGRVDLWKIAMKPGRPLVMARWRCLPVFGLPGNPVAAFVCGLLFARPALQRMAGGRWPEPRRYRVPLARALTKKPGRTEYLRSRIGEDGRAECFRSAGSGLISGLRWSDGLIELDEDTVSVAEGEPVNYLPYAELGIQT